MTLPTAPKPAATWPFHSGDMAARIRRMGSESSPLGPPHTWPDGLRSAIAMILPSKATMVVFWGPELITFYNDAYTPALGNKHPLALGRRAVDVWPEVWSDLGPLLMGVWTTGETFSADDWPFKIERHGYLEDVLVNLSCSPLHDARGAVAGLL